MISMTLQLPPIPATGAFQALVQRLRPLVDGRLQALLRERLGEAHALGDLAAVEAGSALCLRGGKRWRAALIAAAHRACGGADDDPAVIEAGVAIELLQTYLLIHDDWMDADELRRGGPSVHAALRDRFGSERDGDAGAVLAGDYLSAIAVEVLLAAPVPSDRLAEAARVFARMHREVVLGQILDTTPGATAAVETIYDLKAGSYTVRGPLLLGAALAGGAGPAREALEAFAAPVGIAFQLRDELLGAFGDPAVTGKPAGGDLRRGKRTALVQDLGRSAAAAPVLARVLGVAEADDADVAEVTRLLVASGGRARVEARIAELAEQARAALASAPLERESARLLLDAASMLTDRIH
jgi:geranylgeranyl diphosphate synthase type I